MITKKAYILNVMKTCDGVDTLTREEKFEVFVRVCDNMLAEGRLSKANHTRWTNIFWSWKLCSFLSSVSYFGSLMMHDTSLLIH